MVKRPNCKTRVRPEAGQGHPSSSRARGQTDAPALRPESSPSCVPRRGLFACFQGDVNGWGRDRSSQGEAFEMRLGEPRARRRDWTDGRLTAPVITTIGTRWATLSLFSPILLLPYFSSIIFIINYFWIICNERTKGNHHKNSSFNRFAEQTRVRSEEFRFLLAVQTSGTATTLALLGENDDQIRGSPEAVLLVVTIIFAVNHLACVCETTPPFGAWRLIAS